MIKLFVDVETSGLDAFQHGILSIGAYEPESGRGFYEEYRLPDDVEVSEKALEVNGFTVDDIYDENKLLPVEGASQFIEFIASFGDRVQLSGWNVSFDRMFMENHLFELERPTIAYYWFDVASVASALTGNDYLSMKKASKLYGVTPEDKVHNALEGAKNCARLWSAIDNHLNELNSQNGEW